jgi:Fe-S-cluster containining protein
VDSPSPYRPRLRPDLDITPGPDGNPQTIRYKPLDRRVDLGAVASAVAALLDGTRTAAELVGELAALYPADEVEGALRHLLFLNLAEGFGDAIVARLAALRAGEELSYTLLDGARFECQGSGECCQNYNLGPITPGDVARLEGLGLEAEYGPGPYHVEDGEHLFLKKGHGDRCMFLQEDNKCGVHARFGADAKPLMCRSYPIETLGTIDGLKVFDKGSCATFARSARAGQTLVEQLPQLLRLLPREHGLYHPIVRLGQHMFVDYGHYLPVCDAQLQIVDARHGLAGESLRAIGRQLELLDQAVNTCPIQPGQPTAAIDAVLRAERPPLFVPPTEERVRAGVQAISDVARDLLTAESYHIGKAHDALNARLSRELAQLIHLLQTAAQLYLEPQADVGDYFRDIVTCPLGGEDVDEVTRLSIKTQLFGSRALVNGNVRAGLLRVGLVQLLAAVGARMLGRMRGLPAALASDLSFGHMRGVRLLTLGTSTTILLHHEDRTPEILDALPALLAVTA